MITGMNIAMMILNCARAAAVSAGPALTPTTVPLIGPPPKQVTASLKRAIVVPLRSNPMRHPATCPPSDCTPPTLANETAYGDGDTFSPPGPRKQIPLTVKLLEPYTNKTADSPVP